MLEDDIELFVGTLGMTRRLSGDGGLGKLSHGVFYKANDDRCE